MDYPDVYGFADIVITPMDGSELRRAQSGAPRVRRLWSTTRYRIEFAHKFVTHDDHSAMMQFYGSYKSQEITWTDPSDGNAYTVLMLQPPKRKSHNGVYCDVSVVLEGSLNV